MPDELERFKDELAEAGGFALLPAEAKELGLCAVCGKRGLENCYSDAGRLEWRISGMCERCFDEIAGTAGGPGSC